MFNIGEDKKSPKPVERKYGLSLWQSLSHVDLGEIAFSNLQGHRKSSFLPQDFHNVDPQDQEEKFTLVAASAFYPPGLLKDQEVKKFCTRSKYIGNFNKLGMTGKGVYRFPHGVIYSGNFNKNGEFHGTGVLYYPGGQQVEGVWKNGKLLKGANYVTTDNVNFASQYCRMPDRRFQIEAQNELGAVGQEYLTNAPNPPRKIKAGCYDLGDGFYDPQERIILDYKDLGPKETLGSLGNLKDTDDMGLYKIMMDEKSPAEKEFLETMKYTEGSSKSVKKIVTIPNEVKEKWIKDNCRKAEDEPVGYNPKLYETWTTGKRDDIQHIHISEGDKNTDDLLIEHLSKLHEVGSRYSAFATSAFTKNGNVVGEVGTRPHTEGFSKMLLPQLSQAVLEGLDKEQLLVHQIRRKDRPKSPRYRECRRKSIKIDRSGMLRFL